MHLDTSEGRYILFGYGFIGHTLSHVRLGPLTKTADQIKPSDHSFTLDPRASALNRDTVARKVA